MKISGNIKFLAYVILVFVYLYVLDPSVKGFLYSTKRILELDFQDLHLLKLLIWLVGFSGILMLLNASNKYIRPIIIALFVVVTSLNYICVFVLHTSVSVINFSSIGALITSSGMSSGAIIKLLSINAIFIALLLLIKPARVNLNRLHILLIALPVLVSFFVVSGENIYLLQSVYMVPSMFIYKWSSYIFAVSKQS